MNNENLKFRKVSKILRKFKNIYKNKGIKMHLSNYYKKHTQHMLQKTNRKYINI